MSATRILKVLKVKPSKVLELEPVNEEKCELSLFVPPTYDELPAVTARERMVWAAARAKQREYVQNGLSVPVEGWSARVKAMKVDGRLYKVREVEGCEVWHIRDM